MKFPSLLLQQALLEGANDRTAILSVRPLGSGAARVETARGVYFAKWHSGPADAPDPLDAEAKGLSLLRRAASGLVLPLVIGFARDSRDSLLLTEWLEAGGQSERSAAALGEGLALLHRHLGDGYGLDHDNFIGPTPQPNTPADDWPTFYASQRILPMARRLAQTPRWNVQRQNAIEHLVTRLPDLLAHDPPPSLLHGDLWGGNWMALRDDRAAIFDPAIYFGDRETDLAMTKLFGGFPRQFYDAYHAAWPLEPGDGEREPLYTLYHLLNHLFLFGESYGTAVDRILNRLAP